MRYITTTEKPDSFAKVVSFLSRHGVSLMGSRELTVRGRKSGNPISNPVNLLKLEGAEYLVAPRGHTQWVRNLRAAGTGELRLGRKREQFAAVEVPDAEKPAILRAYLRKWKFEVGMFFEGVDHNADDAKLLEIAPGYPVFRVEPVAA